MAEIFTSGPSSAPIIEQDYTFGANVVDIGLMRVARGKSRRLHTTCRHLNVVYDAQERRIWCKDCERDVEPFDAFMSLTQNMHAAMQRLAQEREAIEVAKTTHARRIAVKALDALWRGKSLVPVCPHCDTGLFADDFGLNPKTMSAPLAAALRRRAHEQ